MTIEGLGKKFQEARLARGLTLDEAARMTKIRPSRLAEIEAEDFSQFPSLAYAKGFLLIYGKFLDIDVTPYLEAFEGSENVTVDGYSYLQETVPPKPSRPPVVRRTVSERRSLMPLVIGAVVLIVGFFLMKLVLNIQRIAPRRPPVAAQAPAAAAPVTRTPVEPASTARGPATVATSPVQSAETNANKIASAPPVAAAQTSRPATTATPAPSAALASVARESPPKEPEIRRAEPVKPEDLAKPGAANAKETPETTESSGPNRVDIRPLKKTYVKIIVDNEATTPAFERWISPGDGTVEFRGQHIAVRVLDRDAIQIKKNGKVVTENDADITVE
ncbi:MAG: helix-turn-helix domain-containing protein [Chthoniobacterales bacterium]